MRVPAQLLKAVAAVFVLAMAAHSAGVIYYNRRSSCSSVQRRSR